MSMIEQMMKPELARKSENRNLLKTVSAGCVKDNERQCNIFQLDAKCYQAVNMWQEITECL